MAHFTWAIQDHGAWLVALDGPGKPGHNMGEMMRAKLRLLHSPDVLDLQNWKPSGADFGILVQALIGPDDNAGEESFAFIVCTSGWFERERMRSDAFVSGNHTLFVRWYDYAALMRYVENAVQRAEADSWTEVAKSLSWLGAWEFDNYRP